MKVKVGEFVRHRGTKLWGKVVEVIPQHDTTSEVRIRYLGEPPSYAREASPGRGAGEAWWGSYHIDHIDHAMDREPTPDEQRRPWTIDNYRAG